MNSLRRLLPLAALLCAAAALPTTAAAAASIPISNDGFSNLYDVAIANDDAAIVAYHKERPTVTGDRRLHVCRIAPAATSCVQNTNLLLATNDGAAGVRGPWVLVRGATVHVVWGQGFGNADYNSTWRITSTNGGKNFGSATKVSTSYPQDITLSPDGARFWIATDGLDNGSNSPSYGDRLDFTSAPVNGPATSGGARIDTTKATITGGREIGITPDGKPIVHLNTNVIGLGVYRFLGNPASGAALNNAANWTGPAPLDAPDAGGGFAVASGPSGLWGHQSQYGGLTLRKWVGTKFGPAIRYDCRNEGKAGGGVQLAPFMAVDGAGQTHLAEVVSDTKTNTLLYAVGNPAGTRFSRLQKLAASSTFMGQGRIAVGTGGKGVVIYGEESPTLGLQHIKVVRLPTGLPQNACDPGPPAIQPPVKPQFAFTKFVKVSKVKKGYRLFTLSGPKKDQCAPSAQALKFTVGSVDLKLPKGKKARAKAKKQLPRLRKVTFSVDGKTVKTDKTRTFNYIAPANTLAPGKHKLKAKLSYTVGKSKKAKTKNVTLTSSWVVCAIS